jgi:hypothetical protein
MHDRMLTSDGVHVLGIVTAVVVYKSAGFTRMLRKT